MPTVNDILRHKTSNLITVGPYMTVLDAVQTMNRNRIGAVLVVDTEGELAGIFTERDVLTRVISRDLKPREVAVGDVMTSDVLTCRPETDLDEIAEIMKARRIRHIPIRDDYDHLIGMVSIGDINAYHVQAKQALIDNMTDYICGRG